MPDFSRRLKPLFIDSLLIPFTPVIPISQFMLASPTQWTECLIFPNCALSNGFLNVSYFISPISTLLVANIQESD